MNTTQDDQAFDWLKHSEIKLPEGKSIKLEKPQRYQLIKLLFKSTKYSDHFKNELLEKEKSVNFSDFDTLEELGCLASKPEDNEKTKLFLKYTGLDQLPKGEEPLACKN